MRLSVVIPIYNEERTIESNIGQINEQLLADGIDAEYILVDDGSTDETWAVLNTLSQEMKQVTCLRFSRNFGKEAAILAGIKEAQGDRCLIMDSDLQHPPRYIKIFMEKMDETGADVVEGVKADRGKQFFFGKLFAGGFYKIFSSLSGIDIKKSSDFKLLNKKVMEVLRDYSERYLFFRGLTEWSGFVHVQIPFPVDERKGDTSKFSVKKLFLLASNSILAYTSKPLYLTVLIGLLFLVCAAILGIQTLINYFSGDAVSGFTTLILLNLIIGSLVLISIGIIGAYIARIYNEIKERPQYIVSERATWGLGDK